MSRLLSGDGSTLAIFTPGWLSLVALIGLSVLPLLGAVFLFPHLDLTE